MIGSWRRWKLLVWAISGVLISIMLAFFWFGNGRAKQGSFWSNGNVYDFSSEELRIGTASCQYIDTDSLFHVIDENADLLFVVSSDVNKWKEAKFELSGLNVSEMKWRIYLLNDLMEEIKVIECVVTDGWNYVDLDMLGTISFIRIEICGYSGTTFSISEAKICQNNFDFIMKKFLWRILWIFCEYIVISIIVYFFRNYDWYLLIKKIQYVFSRIGDGIGGRFYRKFSVKARNSLRTGVFCLLFLLMIPLNIFYEMGELETTRYVILGITAGIITISFLSWEMPLKYVNWRKPIVCNWLFLCAMLALSDVIVKKEIPYSGIILWFALGGCFFVWQNTGNYDFYFRNIIQGLAYTLPVIVLYCLIFREKRPGVLYNGCFSNNESMAIYMTGIFIAFLIKLSDDMKKTLCRRLNIVINMTGLSVSLYYIYCTRVFACLFLVIVLFTVWIYKKLKGWKTFSRYITFFTLSLVISIGTIGFIYYMDHFLPSKLGTNIIYVNEIYKSMPEKVLTDDAFEKISGWMEMVRYEWKDRKIVWENYIRSLNLFGHSARLQIFQKKMGASNALLEVAYTYGIFCVVPYLILLLEMGFNILKKKEFSKKLVAFTFIVLSMFMNIEKVFLQPLWILFYFEVGKMFQVKEKNSLQNV
ncbi:MAG: hypothetical protein HFI76_00045 [Lachnospiraceae bacterium]|nr:hypothetical protein [Lachnospiraceae bacterium]